MRWLSWMTEGMCGTVTLLPFQILTHWDKQLYGKTLKNTVCTHLGSFFLSGIPQHCRFSCRTAGFRQSVWSSFVLGKKKKRRQTLRWLSPVWKLLSHTESKFVPGVMIQEDTEPLILLVINQREGINEKQHSSQAPSKRLFKLKPSRLGEKQTKNQRKAVVSENLPLCVIAHM